ncbi:MULTISPECIES: hypothetical protein [Corynebacterium]|uniref:hypothetical protein n=1 Tax=Corynebacterium TaxID=1716 RepID=UPI0008A5D7C5|nr:hypothetical protein [Corynebacterium sp. HMSC14H10]OFU59982.1 hypothetical protein HMPREF3135_08705 [Corynebacterium sp. HMSC14H10]
MARISVTPTPLLRLDGASVSWALGIIDRTDICFHLETWRREEGYDPQKGGRPKTVSDRAILALYLILARSGQPMHLTTMVALLASEDTTEKALELLELPSRDKARRVGDNYFVQHGLWYHRLWRALHRFLELVDPFDNIPHHARLTRAEFNRLMDEQDPKRREEKWQRATYVFNQLVMASTKDMPEEYLNNWQGDLTLDGTLIPGVRRGNNRWTNRPDDLMSSEPEAGWYSRDERQETHGENKRRKNAKHVWGWEATLVAGVIRNQGPYAQPHLIMGMAFDRPSHSPAIRGLQAMRHLTDDPSTPKGVVVGDRAYFAVAKTKDFHEPLRKKGYTLVGDYKSNQLGQRGSFETMSLVEGHWYCPAMPKSLIEATEQFRAGLIDEDTYKARINERRAYAMRRKGVDDTGESQMFICPGRGRGKTLVCPLVQKAERQDARAKGLPIIPTPSLEAPRSQMGKCCTNKSSVTIPHTEGIRYRQTGPAYKTPEWQKIYGTWRNVIETRNDYVKNNRGGAAIGDHTRRPVRGFAAAFFYTALGVVAANASMIRRFLGRVERDEKTPPPKVREPHPPRDPELASAHPNAPPAQHVA